MTTLNTDIPRLAAALTRLESSPKRVLDMLPTLDINRGRVTVVTGAPGAGKSSLIQPLLTALAARGERVGAILIDPSSAVTGGAVLGDRLRMLNDERRDRIFLRSVAARSGGEGVGTVAPAMAWTLLNHGFDHVFIESVGIGQQELDVANRGEVLALVLGPDSGDWVQFIKSGILELCDLIAVTKADLGTTHLTAEVRQAVSLQSFRTRPVPVIAVSSQTGTGVEELIAEIDRAHEMAPAQRARSRASVVRDMLARLVLAETRERFTALLREKEDASWRDQLQLASDFLTRWPRASG